VIYLFKELINLLYFLKLLPSYLLLNCSMFIVYEYVNLKWLKIKLFVQRDNNNIDKNNFQLSNISLKLIIRILNSLNSISD